MEPQNNTQNEDAVVETHVEDTAIVQEDTVTLIHTEDSTAPAPKKPLLTMPAAILTGLVLIALAILVAVPHAAKTTAADSADAQPDIPTSIPADVATLRSDDLVRGDANAAQVLIFEYSDSDCPFCVKFHPTLENIVKEYNGKVAWVYRYFPLDIHPNSYAEAEALQCAATLKGTAGFWAYLDRVINITLNPDPESNKELTSIATDQGMDAKAFTACLADPKTAVKIDTDSKEAQDIGARGTPFSVAVNKKTGKQVVIPGAYPEEAVKQMIDSIL